jgi:hypothetical protein
MAGIFFEERIFEAADVLHLTDLDFYQCIRLVNYTRKASPPLSVLQDLSPDAQFLHDDAYLLPVLPDDPLLRMSKRGKP